MAASATDDDDHDRDEVPEALARLVARQGARRAQERRQVVRESCGVPGWRCHALAWPSYESAAAGTAWIELVGPAGFEPATKGL